MSKPSPARYRTTNWSSYTASLKKRGSLLIRCPATHACMRERGRKVHLAMDTATSDIRAVDLTPGSDGDSPVLPELLEQIPESEEIGTVTAPYRQIASQSVGGQVNACIHRQAPAGQRMRCLKAFGERIPARHPDSQTAEIQIRITLINRFNALGTAEILRMA